MSDITKKISSKIITRIEVIDENGRSYVNQNLKNKIEIHLQDEGRTLKIFVNNDSKNELKGGL